MNRLPPLGLVVSALLTGLLVVSCSDPTTPSTNPEPGVGEIQIDLGASSLTVEVGATRQLQVTVLDAAGAAILNPPLVWETTDSVAVMVYEGGRVAAFEVATATITATLDGATASLEVETIEPVLASIRISPENSVFMPGMTQGFTIEAYSSTGTLIGERQGTWTSSNADVVSIAADGTATAVAEGTAEITAEAEGRTASRTVTVISSHLDPATITAGPRHTCALTFSGQAYCWGGIGSDGTYPDSVHPSGPQLMGDGRTFVALAGGNAFTIALDESGAAWSWGVNYFGELGNGTADSTTLATYTPQQVVGGHTFIQVTAGRNHACGLTASGEAYCWGNGGHGQLGAGQDNSAHATPVQVAGGHAFVQIEAGEVHTLGLTADGLLYGWGIGSEPQSPGVSRWEPYPVAEHLRFRKVVAGWLQNGGITLTGEFYMWGSLILWDGSYELVPGSEAFQDMTIGYGHYLAIDSAGALYTWGHNESGQLGDGTRTDRAAPALIASDRRFVLIGSGVSHSIAMTEHGELYEWGSPSSTGSAGYDDQLTPAPPADPIAVVDTLNFGVTQWSAEAGQTTRIGFRIRARNGGFRRTGVDPVRGPYDVRIVSGPPGVTLHFVESPSHNYVFDVSTSTITPVGDHVIELGVSGANSAESTAELPFSVTAPPPPPPPDGTNFSCPTGETELPEGYHCMSADADTHVAGKFSDPELHGTWVDETAEVCLTWNADGTGFAKYKGGTATARGEWGAMINTDGSRYQNERYWMVFTETADSQVRAVAYDSETKTIVNWGFAKRGCPW